MTTQSLDSRIDELPIPGIVLGDYPERNAKDAAPRMTPATALTPLLARFRRRKPDLDPFVLETFARREILAQLSDPSLACIADYIRKQLFNKGFSSGMLCEAMACLCECVRRCMGVVPFATQIAAARLMLDNQLAEMETGEGKTLATALAAGIAALAGIPVHCVTANDYLVTRDAHKMSPLYAMLGLAVGTVTQDADPAARRQAYAKDITYCTAKELAFDYLKDRIQLGRVRHDLLYRVHAISQMDSDRQQPYLRGLCMAIIDEADSVLIDEAGTSLILAGTRKQDNEGAELLQAMRIARNLRSTRHFQCLGERVELTDQARAVLAHLAPDPKGVLRDPRRREELVIQALAALHGYERDRHYVIREGKVCIIDQTTGRLAHGRTWTRGLHQLIEAKEGCEPTGRQDTLAQISYQRFFPRYLRLAGISGTLREARRELKADYNLAVERVPLRCTSQRRVLGCQMYATSDQKWRHVVAQVQARHTQGRAQLIGTGSVADSEHLSALLERAGVAHKVLNARQDQAEADIVATAGQPFAVTVATNMAGRGTDIVLHPDVAQRGGLHVISCQLNGEARIDRQLHGRAARQGDPGSVETILSLEEPLLTRWVPVCVRAAVRRLTTPHHPLPAWVANGMVRVAQRLEQFARRAQRRDLIRRDTLNEHRLALGGSRE